jgi:hypothetical protein
MKGVGLGRLIAVVLAGAALGVEGVLLDLIMPFLSDC